MSNPTLYVPLLSGLGELRVLQLDGVTFQHFTDLFKVLQSLSASVKDLRFDNVEFASSHTATQFPTLARGLEWRDFALVLL